VTGRIDSDRVVLTSFLASGALAGLAGGVEIAGLTYALYEGLSPGWGYTAIAVALLAALDPAAVVGTAVLFGALEAGSGAMQREAGIPAVWVVAVEALVILAVLATDQIRRRRLRFARRPASGGGRSGASPDGRDGPRPEAAGA
jgi:simple sugar transport system permease protein